MKKILVNILKVLGFLAYAFLALFIGVGTNSAVIGWGIFLIGVIFVIWRYYKNRQKVRHTSKTIQETLKSKNDKAKLKVTSKVSKSKLTNTNSINTKNIKFSFSDLFKIKEIKAELQNLNLEIDNLQKQKMDLEKNNTQLKKEADLKLSLQQMKPAELEKLINEKNKELKSKESELSNLITQKTEELNALTEKENDTTIKLKSEREKELNNLTDKKKQELDDLIRKSKGEVADLNYHIDQKNKILKDKDSEITSLNQKIKDIKSDLVDVSEQAMYEDYGLYKPHYDFANSSTYKGRLSEVRADQKQMIKEGTAGEIFNPMLLDDSRAKGRSMQKKNIKQLVRSFNGECEAAINKVTKSNIEMIEKRINRSFEQLNKLNESNGVRLTSNYLDSKIDEAHIALEYALKKEQERELLREQRQREKEERQAQKEIAEERAKYEKDETHFQQAKDLLQNKINASKSDVEIESLKKKIAEIQGKLDDVQEKKVKLSNRAENPTAGYVYIISNIGSFGQNIYKIGVTRRLDPMDRINELSSASVPFKFDVHALIFTDNAYKLETELHEYFDRQRVNKVNKRKEFFKLNLDEIKKVLSKHKELTFDFQEIPDATEYRDSLLIEKRQEQQA